MENKNQKSLSIRVRALRKIARLSQEEVAEKVGLSIYNYKSFEEEGKNISYEAIAKLSKILDQDLVQADSEIIISDTDHKLIRVAVKKDNKSMNFEFIQEFIKLNTEQQDLFIQLIQELKNV